MPDSALSCLVFLFTALASALRHARSRGNALGSPDLIDVAKEPPPCLDEALLRRGALEHESAGVDDASITPTGAACVPCSDLGVHLGTERVVGLECGQDEVRC